VPPNGYKTSTSFSPPVPPDMKAAPIVLVLHGRRSDSGVGGRPSALASEVMGYLCEYVSYRNHVLEKAISFGQIGIQIENSIDA
jgi:hypothetical protein